MSQTPNPPLQPLSQTPRARYVPSILAFVVGPGTVGVLQFGVLGVVPSNLNWVTCVQGALALGAVVVLVDVLTVLHLDAVVVDFVGLERAV